MLIFGPGEIMAIHRDPLTSLKDLIRSGDWIPYPGKGLTGAAKSIFRDLRAFGSVRAIFVRLRDDPDIPGSTLADFLFFNESFAEIFVKSLRRVLGRYLQEEDLIGAVSVRACQTIRSYILDQRGRCDLDPLPSDCTDQGFFEWLSRVCVRHVTWARDALTPRYFASSTTVSVETLSGPLVAPSVDVSRQMEVHEIVWKAVDQLPGHLRKVIQQYLCGMTLAESAERLGYRIETVRTYRKQGFQWLRCLLSDDGY